MSRTLKHTQADKQPHPSRQGGAAALIILLMLVLLAASVLMERLNSAASIPTIRSAETAVSLAEAKAALIAWAVTHPETPGMLPYPDGNADAEGYDGLADCAVAGPTPALLLGRLPTAGENIAFSACVGFTDWPMDAPVADADGEPLWYAVSGNLLRNSGVPINSGMLDSPTPAFPWITVRDRNGAILLNSLGTPLQVAAVIIAPGRTLSAVPRVAAGPIDQSGRAAVAAPAAEQFLDGIDVGGTVFANADTDGCADDDVGCVVASGEDFIMAPDSRLTADSADNFNDQLIYITVEELLHATEKRVLGEVAVMLEGYRGTYGRYPWLSPFRRPPPTASSVSAPVAGEKILTDLEAAFLTQDLDDDDQIQSPSVGGPPGWPPGTIEASVASETQLTIEGTIPIADGDPYMLILVGHADAGSSDTTLVNSGGDFERASVQAGDQIRNLTKNVDAVVVSVVGNNSMEIAAFAPFFGVGVGVGDEYNVAPAAFDAVIGTREGNIPFIDTAAGETYTFAAGFTVNSWTKGDAAVVPPDADLDLWTPWDDDWHGGSGETDVEATVLLALDASPWPLDVPATNGVCTWTGDADAVKCRGWVEVEIDLTDDTSPYYPYIAGEPYLPYPNDKSLPSIHGMPSDPGGGHWPTGTAPSGEDVSGKNYINTVRRRFTFDLDYVGDPATVVIVDGVKARKVVSGATLNGTASVMIEESMEFPDGAGWMVVASTTLTAPIGSTAAFDTSIYYDLRDDDELPAWFSANDWSTYIYAKISADHVSGGADDCVTSGNCLSLDIQSALGVRTDVRAALVAAGTALAGQDRERGTCPAGPPDNFICALFESANNTAGNDTAERNTPTVTFNDQVRVVSP